MNPEISFSCSAAKTNVSPPTRPRNIKQIKMILERIPKVGVIPKDKPTVPMAELVSNSADNIGISSYVSNVFPVPAFATIQKYLNG